MSFFLDLPNFPFFSFLTRARKDWDFSSNPISSFTWSLIIPICIVPTTHWRELNPSWCRCLLQSCSILVEMDLVYKWLLQNHWLVPQALADGMLVLMLSWERFPHPHTLISSFYTTFSSMTSFVLLYLPSTNSLACHTWPWKSSNLQWMEQENI